MPCLELGAAPNESRTNHDVPAGRGSPFGATVYGYERLHAIHVELKRQPKDAAASRFEVERVTVPAPGIATAHIKRLALGPDATSVGPGQDARGAFSEMALDVLVRRYDRWWVAAAQNTPIRAGGAI